MRYRSLLLLASCTALAACGAQSEEEQIKAAIQEANYCDTAQDCVLAGSKCPFGCYIYVNTAEESRIQEAIEGYDSTCIYSCVASQGVECRRNKCVAITEPPQ